MALAGPRSVRFRGRPPPRPLCSRGRRAGSGLKLLNSALVTFTPARVEKRRKLFAAPSPHLLFPVAAAALLPDCVGRA